MEGSHSLKTTMLTRIGIRGRPLSCLAHLARDPRSPKHLWTAEAAGGAHHLVFSPDGSRAYVQNSLLNIEGMNDGLKCYR